METCFACGGEFEPVPGGAVHSYMLSSAGCWSAYGKVLEREYSDPFLFAAAHRLTVDAFALQHPGNPTERRAVQSFWIHGASLWLVLRMGESHSHATKALKLLAGQSFESRPSETPKFSVTHADILAGPLAEHAELALTWAQDALACWSEVHDEFERLAQGALGGKANT